MMISDLQTGGTFSTYGIFEIVRMQIV